MVELRENIILTSSPGKYMADHGSESFKRASKSDTEDKITDKNGRDRKPPRHIVRSKTPRKKKDG